MPSSVAIMRLNTDGKVPLSMAYRIPNMAVSIRDRSCFFEAGDTGTFRLLAKLLPIRNVCKNRLRNMVMSRPSGRYPHIYGREIFPDICDQVIDSLTTLFIRSKWKVHHPEIWGSGYYYTTLYDSNGKFIRKFVARLFRSYFIGSKWKMHPDISGLVIT